ncbi:MAG: DUF2249 domain-containing protein [Candidatus Eisenbacteria bacterium]
MNDPRDENRSAPSPTQPTLRHLDVRPILARGTDPLEEILAALDPLPPGSAFHVLAPFRPNPLLDLLAERGHRTDVAELGPAWSVTVLVGGGGWYRDLRNLPPPEPMEAVLAATVDGGPFLARLPRHPRLLEDQLRRRARRWEVLALEDGSALLWVAP